jgi:hypothetical protein
VLEETVFVSHKHFHGSTLETSAFKPLDNLADQRALDSVWFKNNKGSFLVWMFCHATFS